MNFDYDIIVVGGGTAGMTAAIYASRAGKSVLLLESENFGGQITSAPKVENYPGIKSISGSEFADDLYTQTKDLGVKIELEGVTSIENIEGGKKITTEYNAYNAKAVILATGGKHRHLGLEREEEMVGKGVSYCAVCDGAFFKNKEVAVVGGGSAALQSAGFLSNYCTKVYLIHRRDEFRGEKKLADSLREKENIEFVLNSTVEEIIGENVLNAIKVKNKLSGEIAEISVTGLFIAVGQQANNDIFRDIVELDNGGFIVAGEDCVTSCEGIYAAGDCRTKEVRQLTTAAGDGAVAALAACSYVG